MSDETCAWAGCRYESWLTHLGVPVCQVHWNLICQYSDWRDMRTPRLRPGFTWPDRSKTPAAKERA